MTKEEANRLILKIRDEMYDKISWYVWNHCHDEELTKEILQEVFLEVCKHVEVLAMHECYGGWVYKVAKYKLMKLGKANILRNQRQVALEEIQELAREDAYDFLVFDEYSHVLSPEQINLLKLHYFEGHTMEDIAEEKGKTVGAIKMQLKRARDKLGQYLKDKENA